MSKIILFSKYKTLNMQSLVEIAHGDNIKEANVAVLPANGNIPEIYMPTTLSWFEPLDPKEIFVIEASCDKGVAQEKLKNANIVLATGGNVCYFITWLRKLELMNILKEKILTEDIGYLGFSAGAMILTPNINIACGKPFMENEEIKLKDTTALGILDYEIWPHYTDDQKEFLEEYQKTTGNEVRTMSDEEWWNTSPHPILSNKGN